MHWKQHKTKLSNTKIFDQMLHLLPLNLQYSHRHEIMCNRSSETNTACLPCQPRRYTSISISIQHFWRFPTQIEIQFPASTDFIATARREVFFPRSEIFYRLHILINARVLHGFLYLSFLSYFLRNIFFLVDGIRVQRIFFGDSTVSQFF